MKVLAIALAIFLVLTGIGLAAVVENGVVVGTMAMCKDRHPDDFDMQEFCYNRELKAMFAINDLMEETGVTTDDDTPLGKAFAQCANRYYRQKFDAFEFVMVHYCMQKQLEAYERMHGAVKK